jgi:PAS domain S-box-containing protein
MALAISKDIEERKRADEALRVSEASYRAIFDAAEDAIFVIDIETAAIVDANPKASASFGYGREEFRRLDLGTLGSGVHPYTQQGAMDLFARAVSGEQLRVEWHGKTKDGDLRWQEVFGKRVTIGGQMIPLAAILPTARWPRRRCARADSTAPCSMRRRITLNSPARGYESRAVADVRHSDDEAPPRYRRGAGRPRWSLLLRGH